MKEPRPAGSLVTRVRITFLTGLANMAGVAVVIAFFILTEREMTRGNGLHNYLAAAFLLGLGVVWGNLWSREGIRFARLPLEEQLNHPELERYQAQAVNTPLVTAFISLAVWALAGPLIGIVGPLLYGTFDLSKALLEIFGISLIGGPITTICVFFIIEAQWQKNLPEFLRHHPIHNIPGAVRIPVKARMVSAILLVSLIPLLITAITAYLMAQDVASAGAAEKEPMLRHLSVTVTFLVLACGTASVGVAIFLAGSIAGPLRSLSLAMARVARGDFKTRVKPATNDEIGALADGFNDMIQGLEERERIKKTMQRYLDPEIAHQILSGRIDVEGEMKDVTLLFSDLRAFTSFAEQHHPKEVLAKINRYFSAMTAVIRNHGGTVFQYVGDEIEAVFGAPLADPLHPDRAVAAALEEINREWAEKGEPPLAHGVGIHSGVALAGNVGSHDRQSYALVGDTVNTASRVAGLCRDFETDLLVSESTVQRLTSPRGPDPVGIGRGQGA